MFSTPLPRASFLDSPLRASSHENRRLARGMAAPARLGHRLAPAPSALDTRLHETAPDADAAA